MEISTSRGKGIAALGLGLALALTSTFSHAQEGDSAAYRVKITNIMGAGQFTPILAATHSSDVSLFTLGDAPSAGLAALAEGGDTSALQDELSSVDAVDTADTFVFSGDVPLTFAGTTVEFVIITEKKTRRLSVAAMILPTNDSFMALDTVSLPRKGTRTYYALGYDAGSEVNDELCMNIPGPTCGGDGAFTEINGEGFVHISRGIQGIGDLRSEEYDWRNPVAKVEVTRIK